MNKDRLSFTAGFLPAVSLAILMGFDYASKTGAVKTTPYIYALTEGAAFLFPFVILLLIMREGEVTYRFKGSRARFFPFIFWGALAVSCFSFLLNWVAARLIFDEYTAQSDLATASGSIWLTMFLMIFLPAVCEELFFRGGMLSALEGGGFYSAMAATAISFALVHGDAANFIGPLAAGVFYAYVTYIAGSVRAAIWAHFISNGFSFTVNYLLTEYSAVGLWKYFVVFITMLFFLSLYIAMGRLEKLIEKGKVPKINRVGFSKGFSALVFSPGLWVTAVLFIIKLFVF